MKKVFTYLLSIIVTGLFVSGVTYATPHMANGQEMTWPPLRVSINGTVVYDAISYQIEGSSEKYCALPYVAAGADIWVGYDYAENSIVVDLNKQENPNFPFASDPPLRLGAQKFVVKKTNGTQEEYWLDAITGRDDYRVDVVVNLRDLGKLFDATVENISDNSISLTKAWELPSQTVVIRDIEELSRAVSEQADTIAQLSQSVAKLEGEDRLEELRKELSESKQKTDLVIIVASATAAVLLALTIFAIVYGSKRPKAEKPVAPTTPPSTTVLS